MKTLKLAKILCLLVAAMPLAAQTDKHIVQWQGIDTWYADTVARPVIKVQNACYSTADLVPTLGSTIKLGENIPSVTLQDAHYVPVTPEEAALLMGTELPQQPTVTSYMHRNVQGEPELCVEVFPFVLQNGQMLKLAQYSLAQDYSQPHKVPASTGLHSYAPNSVLANGSFVKIRVSGNGLYQLPYSTLQSMGIDPANVRVFGYGGGMLAQNFLLDKQDDLPEIAVYDNGSAIVFYAQGPVSWNYSKATQCFQHTQNPYSDYGYYFVTSSDVGSKKRVATAAELPADDSDYIVETFTDCQVHERDLLNLIDVSGNAGGGREFFGEQFTAGTTNTISFSFPNIVPNSPLQIRSDVAARSSVQTSFTLTSGSVSNILNLGIVSSNTVLAVESNRTFSNYVATTDNCDFTYTYNSSSSGSKAYLNYLEVNAVRKLKMAGASLVFCNIENYREEDNSQYVLTGASASTFVWNITHPENMFAMSTSLSNDTLRFVAPNDTLLRFVALDANQVGSLPVPEIVGAVANQNLHALPDVDMVILTHPDFVAQSERLANAHRTIDGLTVAVVTSEQTYNEFSSGTPDATAYRWLMKMLYDRAVAAGNTRPKYLLLMGDGTFDNRKLLLNSGENKLLTYQAINSVSEPEAYPCDEYFGFMDDDDATLSADRSIYGDRYGTMDVSVGRFPVSTSEQADNVVNKTIGYMQNQSFGNWKNQIVMLADDGDSDLLHTQQADSVARYISSIVKPFQMSKIYLEAYQQEISASGESYPLAKNKLDNFLRNGMLYFNYTGHGHAAGITNENMLTSTDIQGLSNTNLAFWMLATCSFSHFDKRTLSAAEEALLNPVGGAIGVLSAARTVYAHQNLTINLQVSRQMFTKRDGEYPTVGEAIRLGKRNVRVDYDGINRLSYNLLGDPALRLHYPTPYTVYTDSINGDAVIGNDTVRALQVVTLGGHLANDDGTLADNFNGKVSVQVLDKEVIARTLDNDHVLKDDVAKPTFRDRQSTLFKGEIAVNNGRFSVTFMMPKDIRYNYGTGRINYYAYDTNDKTEGNGYFEDFCIGGSSSTFVPENEGPNLDIYLNSTSFVSGGQVNERPTFLAYMQDENGINTAGSGIGHDLTLMIDNDPEQTYVLNDYFASGETYTQGSVAYKLSEMSAGKHTLTFRAWDLLNNATSKMLDFEVVPGLEPAILSIGCYPNPALANGVVNITIAHDRPNTVLESEVNIFDMTGRKVWSFSQKSADNIQWNMAESGSGAGMYIYQVRLKTTNSEYTSRANKIIVIGQ